MVSPEVTFHPVGWSDRVEMDLGRIADCDARDVAALREAVNRGAFDLWEIREDGRGVGSLIWSLEREYGGTFAYVVNAAAVRGPTASDVTGAMWDAFTEFARLSGARAVRCWTEREGLRRKLESRGAKSKYVLEIVTNEQPQPKQ